MMMKVLLLLLVALKATGAYKIALVPKMTSAVGFYGLTEQGCKDRSALVTDKNVTCFYTGTRDASVEGSLEIINNLIDDDSIDAISISVLDPDAYKPVINRGVALGKPIITFDSDAPDSDRLAYVGTDNYAMGRELAKLLKQIKPDGGTYGMVSGFGLNLEMRVQGVRDEIEESPWIEVVNSPKNGYEDSDISLEKMWELVEEYPNITAIVSVVGLPMFKENTTDWRNFVDSNRQVLTVIADTLPIQLDLMQISYVDALVGQLPYNMGHQSAETLLRALKAAESGIPLNESLPSDEIFITHQLEVLRIPLKLPPLDFDFNYIGNAAIVGYILCAIIILASIGFMAWTWFYRTNQVVVSGQPVFLYMICIGTILMGSAILPLSIDDEKSQRAADIACMCSPWLINIGFTISFSALFSKTWRLNKILLSKNPLRRVKVTEKDVIWPLVVLLTINIISLVCWTAIAPLEFVRTLAAGTDPWNRSIGSYGQCRSTSGAAGNSIPYVVVIAVVNITALGVANFQAYRARNVRTEFNESSYIAMANASFLQAIFVCVPILFLTRENPQAYFIVLSVVLFILCAAILVFVFVPKILALKERKKNGGKKQSSVKISGLGVPSSVRTSTYSGRSLASSMSYGGSYRSGGSADPVTALLQQFQTLSWENKAAVMKKLAPPTTQYSSRSLEQFDVSSETKAEPVKDDTGDQAPTEVILESTAEEVSSDANAKLVKDDTGSDPTAGVTESTVKAPAEVVKESTAQQVSSEGNAEPVKDDSGDETDTTTKVTESTDKAPAKVVQDSTAQKIVQDQPATTAVLDSMNQERTEVSEEVP